MTRRSNLAPAHEIPSAKLGKIQMTRDGIDKEGQITAIPLDSLFRRHAFFESISRPNPCCGPVRVGPFRSTANEDRVWRSSPALESHALKALGHDFPTLLAASIIRNGYKQPDVHLVPHLDELRVAGGSITRSRFPRTTCAWKLSKKYR